MEEKERRRGEEGEEGEEGRRKEPPRTAVPALADPHRRSGIPLSRTYIAIERHEREEGGLRFFRHLHHRHTSFSSGNGRNLMYIRVCGSSCMMLLCIAPLYLLPISTLLLFTLVYIVESAYMPETAKFSSRMRTVFLVHTLVKLVGWGMKRYGLGQGKLLF